MLYHEQRQERFYESTKETPKASPGKIDVVKMATESALAQAVDPFLNTEEVTLADEFGSKKTTYKISDNPLAEPAPIEEENKEVSKMSVYVDDLDDESDAAKATVVANWDILFSLEMK